RLERRSLRLRKLPSLPSSWTTKTVPSSRFLNTHSRPSSPPPPALRPGAPASSSPAAPRARRGAGEAGAAPGLPRTTISSPARGLERGSDSAGSRRPRERTNRWRRSSTLKGPVAQTSSRAPPQSQPSPSPLWRPELAGEATEGGEMASLESKNSSSPASASSERARAMGTPARPSGGRQEPSFSGAGAANPAADLAALAPGSRWSPSVRPSVRRVLYGAPTAWQPLP
uniref:Uncharacterized protein n=1 Tax=Triticum urartu TaxID=4572 RepID=A0A8R7URE7_TRIUA